MRRILVCLIAVTATLLLVCGSVAHAADSYPFANVGFELGDLTGWTPTLDGGGTVLAVTSFQGYTAPDGNYFLLMSGGDGNNYLGQWIALKSGDTFEGWGAFIKDDAPGAVTDWTSLKGVWYSNEPPPGQSTNGWVTFNWVAPADGDYFIYYACAGSSADPLEHQSYGLFDTRIIPAPSAPDQVPEPGTVALLLMGLPLVGILRRRRK